jgi:hypothetical protein
MFEVKRRLSPLLGLHVEEMRLVFAGKQLENGRTIQDYCIQRESTIHVVRKLRGAPDVNVEILKNGVPPLVADLNLWPVSKCVVPKDKQEVVWLDKGIGKLQMFTPEFAKTLFEEVKILW